MGDHPLTRFMKTRSQRDFAALIERERDAVLAIAWRVLADRGLAEDVTQELFLKLLVIREDTGELRSPQGLIARTTIRLALNRLESEKRRARRERIAATSIESGHGDERVDLLELRESVIALPGILRRVLELRYFGGLGTTEVAAELGMPVRTVSAHHKEAMEVLRRRIGRGASAILVPLAADAASGVPTLTASPDLVASLDRLSTSGAECAKLITSATTASTHAVAKVVLPVVLAAAVAIMVYVDRDGAERALEPINAARAESQSIRPTRAAESRRPDEDGPPRGETVPGGDAVAGPAALTVTTRDPAGSPVDGGILMALATSTQIGAGRRLDSTLYYSLVNLHDPKASPFVLEVIPADLDGLTFRMQAVAEGWACGLPQEVPLAAGMHETLDLAVRSVRSVSFAVHDARTGRPVPGAAVAAAEEIRRHIDGRSATGRLTVTTDADGRAVIPGLGVGAQTFEVSAPGYRPATPVFEEGRLPDAVEVDLISLPATGALVVELTPPSPVSAAGMRVVVKSSRAPRRRRVTLDDSGRCEVPDLVPGRYTVELDALEYLLALRRAGVGVRRAGKLTAAIDVRPGEHATAELGVLTGSGKVEVVVGGIADDGDHAVELSGPVRRDGHVGPGGRLAFEAVPAGVYAVTIGPVLDRVSRSPKHRARLVWGETPWTVGEVTVRDGETTRFAATLGTSVIEGRAFDADSGEPIAKCCLYATGAADTTVDTDERGRFRLAGVVPGRYRIGGVASGRRVCDRVVLEVATAASRSSVDLPFHRGTVLVAEFTDEGGGPPERLEVELRDGHGDLLAFDPASTGKAAEEWKSGILPPGRYRLRYRPDERTGWKSLTIEVAGERERQTVEIVTQ